MLKKENWSEKIIGVLMGLIVAYLITLIGILILAFALYQWNLSVNAAEIGILILYLLSCLVGGMFAGKKLENRKFLWGFFVGVMYFIILLIVSATGSRELSAGWKEIFLPGLVCIFSGMLGGMLV